MEQLIKWGIRAGIALAIFVLALIFWPLVGVPAGTVGVVTLFGKVQPDLLQPGLNLVNPLVKVHAVTTQILKHSSNGDAASKDLQQVHTTITTNYNLIPAVANKLYSEIGMNYEDKIFDGAAQETFKAVTAQYTAEELITRREEVRAKVADLFKQKITALSDATIRIDDIQITNFQFSAAFNQAIESKQVAEQQALKAKRDLDRIKVEADQARAKAAGMADAAVLEAKGQAAAFKAKSTEITPQMLSMAAIDKWDGSLPYYMGSGNMPFLDLQRMGGGHTTSAKPGGQGPKRDQGEQ